MTTWASDVNELPMSNKQELYKKMMTAIEYVFDKVYYNAKPHCTHCLDSNCSDCENFYKDKYPKLALEEITDTLYPIYKVINEVKYKGFKRGKKLEVEE